MDRTIIFFGALLWAYAAQADIPAHVRIAATQHGVPVELALAIIRQESNFKPQVTGRAGEIGLGQIKLRTARGVGYRGSARGLYDVATNLHYAMAYLGKAWRKAGNFCAAATLYNAGIGARPHCSAYGRQIVRNLRKHK